jgi:hypothetical protein
MFDSSKLVPAAGDNLLERTSMGFINQEKFYVLVYQKPNNYFKISKKKHLSFLITIVLPLPCVTV